MSDKLLITNVGLAAVVNAEHNGTAPVVISHVTFGSGQYSATADQTKLVAPIKDLTAVSGGSVSDNVIHITVEDAANDSYAVYEVGVFLSDGTLFAVYSQTTPILEKSEKSIALLSLDITFSDFQAGSITIGDTNFFNPPATTEIKGVVELATNNETIDGVDTERAVTPASLHAKTATTSRIGLIEIATDAEVLKGGDKTRALTPNNLLAAFLKKHGDSGFQRLPNGLILEWGKALVANGSSGTEVVFPVSFPTKCTGVYPASLGTVTVTYSLGESSQSNVTIRHNGNGGVMTHWFAVGF